MRKKIGQATLHLYLPQKSLKNGNYTPFMRIIFQGEHINVSTRCEVSQKEWQKYEDCPPENHPLTVEWEKMCNCVRTLVSEGNFSLPLLKDILRGAKNTSVQAFARELALQLRTAGKHNTANLSELTAKTLDAFSGGAVRFSQCDVSFCKRYIEWLRNVRHNSPTTISIRARNLSSILSKATDKHLIKENPMRKVKVPSGGRKELDISESSLRKLLNATPTELPEKEFHYLQYFRCLYYGNGINIGDLLRLRHEDISGNEIIYYRKKTEVSSSKKLIRIPLLPQLAEALNRLAGGKRHIIPVLEPYTENSEEEFKAIKQTTKTINKYLGRACETLHIREKVTTNLARHAFATRLLQKGIPVEFISAALGHSNIQTTRHYLEGYTKQQRKEAAKMLIIDYTDS